ncbi:MAG: hypothetical protein GY742_11250 [Hyphomicrobiales bacterium]|nr:hypothetical protein [Hyphomicrobiales bacterium]
MKTLSDLFAPGKRRGPQALERLQGAYERLFFSCGASIEDQQIVLADLAAYSGHFFVDGANSSDEEIREANGKRLIMGRIIRLGLGKEGDLSALYKAAVKETQTNQKEKQL